MTRSFFIYPILTISFLFAFDPASKHVEYQKNLNQGISNEIQKTDLNPVLQKLKTDNQERAEVAKGKHEELKQTLNATIKDVRKRYS